MMFHSDVLLGSSPHCCNLHSDLRTWTRTVLPKTQTRELLAIANLILLTYFLLLTECSVVISPCTWADYVNVRSCRRHLSDWSQVIINNGHGSRRVKVSAATAFVCLSVCLSVCLLVCFCTRYLNNRCSHQTRHRNVPPWVLKTNLFWGPKVKG